MRKIFIITLIVIVTLLYCLLYIFEVKQKPNIEDKYDVRSNILGACCINDSICIVIEKYKCLDIHNGRWISENTICDPHPCINIVGACCVDDKCYIGTREKCKSINGDYQGHYTICDSNPCSK